ncbi:STAS/SEC14 domain-containing protein [Pacificoceanicola onchidii]|uniref:STAS/SEC14 domain-containing protein n=1 Tax=Pacificoceanicola onchidii TaxID=2562685 RepID=UPI0010A4F23A|nr:STAS/SEC14 domain-containing protein [Pacificoceanicola onchidii]
MLKLTNPAPNRIDILLDGPVGANEMRDGLDAFVEMASGMQGGQILYRIPEFAMPSFEAIGIKMAQLPRLFGLFGHFSSIAVLTDSALLRTAAEIEGAVIPGIAIKAFELDEEAAAEAWLAARAEAA